jgi:hypothetical protein
MVRFPIPENGILDTAKTWTTDMLALTGSDFGPQKRGTQTDDQWKEQRTQKKENWLNHQINVQIPMRIAALEADAIEAQHSLDELNLSEDEQAARKTARKESALRISAMAKTLRRVETGELDAENAVLFAQMIYANDGADFAKCDYAQAFVDAVRDHGDK